MNSEFNIAVHCLTLLSLKEERMANSEEIAKSVCTHPARIRKVLGLLRKQGYVTTKEGVGGGYLLNPGTEKVTLGDLYRLLARGSLKPSWCSGGEELPCEVASNIEGIMDQIYSGGEAALERYLDGITLTDVIKQIEEAGSAANPT
ncbi:RrF2 family transcriptional regulator [Paenibacillus cellulositrophicus]|jgi:Rrf2 family protein|uniref:Transcriptional regulator n=3 Tax=Paenibacillus TaxID=44249 RepID=A0A1R1ELA2_9BACL|nr:MULTISPECIES: Rrf2 family transcriptional regulator [Paenibacillus]MBJ9989974.1 Rrf2 family transcriptional regulator [Paenibacillus sp. S28]MCM3000372.1 Rrf2 family transcriptional regulator [Paenibacillus cellulositrophicus]MEC0178899.1 Rrf2 family transcriptional regulator [Paenibacillus favisporus]OMF52623.1 transcriptional regulator [Paenibacillus rhizosphaerae]OXL86202.1 Rrf2 family transcriptional regulator [Paenibacillus sp. SSG-1]